MTKQLKGADLTPELKAKLNTVLAEARVNRFSVSRVFETYNEIFGKDDKPQSCASCLRTRVEALQKWKEENPDPNAGEGDDADDDANVVTHTTTDGAVILYTPSAEDAQRGTVRFADGANVAAGRYELENGDTLIVQVGGRARVEASLT